MRFVVVVLACACMAVGAISVARADPPATPSAACGRRDTPGRLGSCHAGHRPGGEASPGSGLPDTDAQRRESVLPHGRGHRLTPRAEADLRHGSAAESRAATEQGGLGARAAQRREQDARGVSPGTSPATEVRRYWPPARRCAALAAARGAPSPAPRSRARPPCSRAGRRAHCPCPGRCGCPCRHTRRRISR